MAHAALQQAAIILPVEEITRTSTYASEIPRRAVAPVDTS